MQCRYLPGCPFLHIGKGQKLQQRGGENVEHQRQHFKAVGIFAQSQLQLLQTFFPGFLIAKQNALGDIQGLIQFQYLLHDFLGKRNIPAKIFQSIHANRPFRCDYYIR